ncbi:MULTISPECIES: hypothetical protein [unclassified Streptomyces]|uniref:hypothetical protein n=1 Tax=unclassified Streptomyces TaxID=2593676 RepID=UPI0033A95745
MSINSSSPADETAAKLTVAFPGLRQTYPFAIGQPLADTQLDPKGTARYSWKGYDVHVSVGQADYLEDDPDSDAQHRKVRAHATFLVPDVVDAVSRGHVEWDMTMPITEVVAAVIAGTTSVPDAAAALMSRTPKPEQYSA